MFDNRLIVYTDTMTKDYILKSVLPLQLNDVTTFTFVDGSEYTTDLITEVVILK